MPTMIPLNCDYCKSNFLRSKKDLTSAVKKMCKNKFCSRLCKTKFLSTKSEMPCYRCGKPIFRKPSNFYGNHSFCSRSCNAKYHNTNKTYGVNRSKLEIHIEEQIKILYPNLVLLCNDKTAINSELDFYFPDLRLAIELNGIFHYEPIYGPDKLQKVQDNDSRKFLLCAQNNISLAIIDSSQHKYITPKTNIKYWNIFRSILDNHLASISTVSNTGRVEADYLLCPDSGGIDPQPEY